MNGGISIVLPMPTIVLQFPASYGQHIGLTFACTQCGQCPFQQMNEIKEERIETQGVDTEIKTEADAEYQINIKEEPILEFKMDEGILHNDINLYENKFSPISSSNSEDEDEDEDEDNDTLLAVNQQDELSDSVYEQCLNDILELVEYLKEDIVFS